MPDYSLEQNMIASKLEAKVAEARYLKLWPCPLLVFNAQRKLQYLLNWKMNPVYQSIRCSWLLRYARCQVFLLNGEKYCSIWRVPGDFLQLSMYWRPSLGTFPTPFSGHYMMRRSVLVNEQGVMMIMRCHCLPIHRTLGRGRKLKYAPVISKSPYPSWLCCALELASSLP